jgi:hypothetical protein
MSQEVLKLSIDCNFLNSLLEYSEQSAKSPKPPLNFIMNDVDKAYDLRMSTRNVTNYSFAWIIWWVRLSVLYQSNKKKIYCSLKQSSFYCKLKASGCGVADWPIEVKSAQKCLFYVVTNEFVWQRVKETHGHTAKIEIEFAPELFLALSRDHVF